jgi:hypothetical protein
MNLKYFDFFSCAWLDISGQSGASLEYNDASGWITTTGKYKVYVAQLTQTGGDPPVATVLENTLGFVPDWERAGGGAYGFDWDGDFVATKCFIIVQNSIDKPLWFSYGNNYDIDLNTTGDGYITNASFELRYYN